MCIHRLCLHADKMWGMYSVLMPFYNLGCEGNKIALNIPIMIVIGMKDPKTYKA